MVGHIIHNDKTVLAVEQNKVLMPPTYNKYLAWGFSDLSLRIGNYDSDKVILSQGDVVGIDKCPLIGGTFCSIFVILKKNI